MTASPPRPIPLLGRIALHLELISADQLAEATREQAREGGGRSLGTILVSKGFVSEAELQTILKAREQVAARQRAQDPAPGPEPRAQSWRAPDADASGDGALHGWLRLVVERGASDLHLRAGRAPRLRIDGRLGALDASPLSARELEVLLDGLLARDAKARLEARGELVLAFEEPGLGRFRASLYRELAGPAAVFRVLPERPATLQELALPTVLARFTNFRQGLVLIAGPSGSGRSSTLAAMVDLINEERREHIVTLEDPVEVRHTSKRGVVTQRDVGRRGDLGRALRAAARGSADVVAVDELEAPGTLGLALDAAESGRLVLAVVAGRGAVPALARLLARLPADRPEAARARLAGVLRAVVAQRLLAGARGPRRVPALELLPVGPAVAWRVREGKLFEVQASLASGALTGAVALDEALARLVQDGVVHRDEALRHGDDARRLGAGRAGA